MIGGGGCALEIISFLQESQIEVLGYIALEDVGFLYEVPYIGYSIGKYDSDSVNFYIASGSPFVREAMFKEVRLKGMSPRSFIHPKSYTSPRSFFDPLGVIVYPGATINAGALIGSNCLINCGVSIGHGAVITGNCRIGDDVTIGPGAVVLDRLVVNDGAFITSGSIVARDVPAGGHVTGNFAIEHKSFLRDWLRKIRY